MPRENGNEVLMPTEVLSAEEAQARFRSRRVEVPLEVPKLEPTAVSTTLGGIAGEVIAGLFGANPRAGRAVGMVAGRLVTDPRAKVLRAKLGELFTRRK